MEIQGKQMSFEEVCDLFDSHVPTEPGEQVILSNDEINRARRNKRAAQKKAAGFQNTPIYRSLHSSMRLLVEIVQLMPKKTVKITDMLLQNYAELIRWTASAYNHKDPLLKQNAIEESISLMSVVKIMLNCMSGLVGDKKHKQLTASFDAVIRQLVAWRSSLEQSEGPDDEA
jgi:hypothetical protein